MSQWQRINCEMSVINNVPEEILFYVYFMMKTHINIFNMLAKNNY